MVEIPYDNQVYAVSIDFNHEQLQDILKCASKMLYNKLQNLILICLHKEQLISEEPFMIETLKKYQHIASNIMTALKQKKADTVFAQFSDRNIFDISAKEAHQNLDKRLRRSDVQNPRGFRAPFRPRVRPAAIRPRVPRRQPFRPQGRLRPCFGSGSFRRRFDGRLGGNDRLGSGGFRRRLRLRRRFGLAECGGDDRPFADFLGRRRGSGSRARCPSAGRRASFPVCPAAASGATIRGSRARRRAMAARRSTMSARIAWSPSGR